jgi:hypothetical protein
MHPIASNVNLALLLESSHVGHDIGRLNSFVLQGIYQLLREKGAVTVLLDELPNQLRLAFAVQSATLVQIFLLYATNG